MSYSISMTAEKTGLSTHTLRYYDKEGLLPFVDKATSGTRMFKDSDFEWLAVIDCLKKTGMPLKDIKRYIDLCLDGDETLQQRYDLFVERRANAERQIEVLQAALERIKYKCWYYETALEAGTIEVHNKTLSKMALDSMED